MAMTNTFSKEQANQIVNTIFTQLGGMRRLASFVGGKGFVGGECDNCVFAAFRWAAKAANKANYMKITLEADDTYTVTFLSIRGSKMTEKGRFENVYCDMLVNLFESETGLFLHF